MKKQGQNRPKQATWRQIGQVLLGLITSASIVLTIGYWTQSQLPDKNAHLYALDIGQGDALLFRGRDGTNVLIDGGPDDSLLWKISEVLPYFDRQIDLLIITHPHKDHYTGLFDLLDRVKIRQILISPVLGGDSSYKILLEKIHQQKIPIKLASADQDWQINPRTYLDILFPFSDKLFRIRNHNNASIVTKLINCREPIADHREINNLPNCTSVLLTGDAEVEVEQQLLKNNINVKADILKVGHHGSDSSSSEKFLKAVQMKEAVISCKKNNDFGHPHQQTLDNLKKLINEKNIRRTDLEGTIEFVM